jgi:hypothetical protein
MSMSYDANDSSSAESPGRLWWDIQGPEQGGHIYIDAVDQVATKQVALPDLVEAEFGQHEAKWKDDTQYISSLTEKYLHPSYARIIGLGWPAASLILQSLGREPDDWFYALRAITGADPVPSDAAGDMPRMTAAWLDWGKRQGLLDSGNAT